MPWWRRVLRFVGFVLGVAWLGFMSAALALRFAQLRTSTKVALVGSVVASSFRNESAEVLPAG